MITAWLKKRRYKKAVRAAIDQLSGQQGLSATMSESLPRLEAFLSEKQAEGETPEFCATMLLAQVYPAFLLEGVPDERRKLILRQVSEYQTERKVLTGTPDAVTLKYMLIDVTLDGWVDERKLDPATALHMRIEFVGTVGGLDRQQRSEQLRLAMGE